MNHAWEKVYTFHKQFGVPHRRSPGTLSANRVEKRYEWLKEEIEEFREAQTIVEQADAMIDAIYLALGTLVEMGVKPEELFQIVHEANLSKFWEDGKPRYRAIDGKVIKPPTWKDPAPRLAKVIENQKNG